jgi:outer membrane biosynthesis protein TonB
MRVFCPEHKRGFFAPRQSPIKCDNRGHLLGELDFEGQGKQPVEIRWQYCCNCEHFCPADFDEYGLARCAVCTRRSSLLYLCDKCHVISFESNTPLDIKNFTVTADGGPQPSCPGCLRAAPADLHEHDCDELGASFITGLTTCPICEERLDRAPAFPSTVAQYLKRTKSAHKSNVTFDYETESFVPVEDGEFVVINNGDPNAQPIVLPRALQFSTRRDFYEFYQDYYHCPKPDAGEVKILRPAAVTRAGAGWRLQTTGLLEVIGEQPKKKPIEIPQPRPEPIAQKRIEEPPAPPAPAPIPQAAPVRQAPPVTASPAPKPEPAVKTCEGCGASIESKYAFCWKCGSALNARSNGPVVVRSRPLPLPMDDDDEFTVQHDSQRGDAQPGENPMFSWTMAKPPDDDSKSRGSVLKLMGIGVVAFLLLGLGVFGLTRSDSPSASADSTPPPVVEQPVVTQPETTAQPAPEPAVTVEQKTVTPEDELKKLRERRAGANASERSKIFQAIAKVEKQYPRDYRFPYERAKLAAKGSKASSRTEAFKALSVAAERAITNGKAGEMLNGLEADKSGDFQSLAQGRQEWSRLLAALKRKDTSLLGGRDRSSNND